ncbi:MAG: hypothetical protein ABSH22_00935 [Tepidisphaeraceae bacterium]|jgi:hypothetical protein
MNRKPLNPKLPGRYGRMTARELDAEVAAYERPILLSETRPMTAAEKRQWQRAKRRPGRPRQGKGVRVISVSVEQSLLEKADLAARRAGISRAALFAMGLKTVLGEIGKLAG